MSEKLVTIDTFNVTVPAHLAQNRLQLEGIENFITGENQATVGYQIFGGVRLQVRESDGERAIKILRSTEHELEVDEGD